MSRHCKTTLCNFVADDNALYCPNCQIILPAKLVAAVELLKQARPPLDAPGKWIDGVKELTK